MKTNNGKWLRGWVETDRLMNEKNRLRHWGKEGKNSKVEKSDG